MNTMDYRFLIKEGHIWMDNYNYVRINATMDNGQVVDLVFDREYFKTIVVALEENEKILKQRVSDIENGNRGK